MSNTTPLRPVIVGCGMITAGGYQPPIGDGTPWEMFSESRESEFSPTGELNAADFFHFFLEQYAKIIYSRLRTYLYTLHR